MKSYADECVVRLVHLNTHSGNAIKLRELSEVSNVRTGPHELRSKDSHEAKYFVNSFASCCNEFLGTKYQHPRHANIY